MTFSNRCKMNVKFIRRHPELIEKGYLQDTDGKRYKIPRSYLKNLKESEGKYFEHFKNYEDNLMEYLSNHNSSDLIEREKIREEIIRKRNNNFNKCRDF